MKNLLFTCLIITTTLSHSQEYFEYFTGEEVAIPAYSEFYQDLSNPPHDSKVFLGTYTDGIIQYDVYPVFKAVDTLQFFNGYVKAFDYQLVQDYSDYNGYQESGRIAATSSEKELIIYDFETADIVLSLEVPYLLNDVQFSNIDKNVLWGADVRGHLLEINIASGSINLHRIHNKGIARIELFLDKIITSSYDRTIKVTHQKNFKKEQDIKFEIPPLEFDVSADGIMAVAAAQGVALYSIIDKKWLYGKELLSKKACVFPGEKKKYYWNPYLNEDKYWFAGTTQKVTFLRAGHTIVMHKPNGGLFFTELNNPGMVISPQVSNDTVVAAYQNYIFNQDNHFDFLDRYFEEDEYYRENPIYEIDPKAKYIKKIDKEYGAWNDGFPFGDLLEFRNFDFSMDYTFETGDQYGPSQFISLDNIDNLKDSSYANPLHLSIYEINHLIPFPTEEQDPYYYAENLSNWFGFYFFEDCIEDIEEGTFDIPCLLQTKWLSRDTSIFFQTEESTTLGSNNEYGSENLATLEIRDQVVRNVAFSAYVYEHGFEEDPILLPSNKKEVSKEQLYLDNQFERMEQKGHLSTVESFAISPDQRYLATGGQDTKIILWDFYTGVKLKEFDYSKITGLDQEWIWYDTDWNCSFTSLIFHPTQPWIIGSNRSNTSICLDYQSGKILGKGAPFEYGIITNDGQFLIGDNELFELPALEWIDSYEGDYVIENPVYGNQKIIKRPKDLTWASYVEDYRGSELEVIERKMYEKSFGLDHDLYTSGLMSPDKNWYVVDDVIYNKKDDECYNLEDYETDDYRYTPVYLKGVFSADSKYFAYEAYKKIKLFNLETKTFSTITDSTVFKFAAPLQFSPDGQYLVSRVWEIKGGELNWLEEANTNRTLGIYEVATQRKLRHHTGHPIEPMSVQTDSSGRYLLFKSPNFMYLLDRETLEIQQLKIKQESLQYHTSYGNTIISTQSDGTPRIYGILEHSYGNGARYFDFEWNPKTGYFKRYFEDELKMNFYPLDTTYSFIIKNYWNSELKQSYELSDIEYLRDFYRTPDSTNLVGLDTTAYLEVFKRNKTGSAKQSGSFSYNGNQGKKYAITEDMQYIYLPTAAHGIGKYHLPDMELITKWKAHEEHPLDLQLMDDEMISIGNDGNVILWDLTTSPPQEKLRFYGDQEGLFMITPDSYYSATKDNIDFVGFRKGNNFIPISSFDVKYNRPDIVLKSLKSSHLSLIDSYEKAYEKRLKRMGIREDDLQIESLPELKIENLEYLPKFTKDGVLEIVASTSSTLENMEVWVNGVKQITSFKTNKAGYAVSIELVDGYNEIELKGITTHGSSTLPVVYTLEKIGPKRPTNLYVLSLGVSRYADSSFNLAYAAKDAKDVNEVFSALEVFETVSHLTLTDEDVTATAMEEIKEFLSRATINDMVVIYVAGHGLLDENFDYYYAVHDVDFNHPSSKGWSYELFEQLLSSSKANKKLLLFDTCHGGEIDKEELALNESEQTASGDVAFRASKTFNYSAQPSNASELSKTFFGDFRKGVGATVIASSGGAEYAAESDTYKNGIFTYFLRKGLADHEADMNGDHKITVNELRIYLNEEVRKATNGKQNPGTRIVNDKHEMVLLVY